MISLLRGHFSKLCKSVEGYGGTLSLSFAENMLFTKLRYLKIVKKLPGSLFTQFPFTK